MVETTWSDWQGLPDKAALRERLRKVKINKDEDLQKIGEQMLLYRYSPPSVIVNDRLEIVQFFGQTGPFLDPLPGDATLNLLRMVKTGLHLELRTAFQKAKRNGAVRKDGVLVQEDGGLKTVDFEISPIKNIPGGERYYLVVFEEASRPPAEKGRICAAGIRPGFLLPCPSLRSCRKIRCATSAPR